MHHQGRQAALLTCVPLLPASPSHPLLSPLVSTETVLLQPLWPCRHRPCPVPLSPPGLFHLCLTVGWTLGKVSSVEAGPAGSAFSVLCLQQACRTCNAGAATGAPGGRGPFLLLPRKAFPPADSGAGRTWPPMPADASGPGMGQRC